MELKEIIIKPNIKIILESLKNYDYNNTPKGFEKEEFISLKHNFRQRIYKKLGMKEMNEKIFITGHQPELFHPGVLYKDIVLYKLSKKENAIPLHLIIDTDINELFYYSAKKKVSFLELSKFEYFQNDKKTFAFDNIPGEERSLIISILEEQNKEIEHFIPSGRISKIKDIIDTYISGLKEGKQFYKLNEEIRESFLNEKGLEIHSFYFSEFIDSPEYRSFLEHICVNKDEFIRIYNESLEKYRKDHKIKNSAQPLPNLEKDELPFWKLNRETGIREKVYNINPNDFIIPRAITLTMFLRLFSCDLFIHGIGGARYEEVSENIIKEFFEFELPPHLIVSATMNLVPKSPFNFDIIDEKDLQKKIRDLSHSPEKFLPPENEFVIKKRELQKEFSNPDSDKKELHKNISKLNEEMKILVKDEIEKTENLLKDYPKYKNNNLVFTERHFPFFYYDIEELINKQIED
ncbi:MAG: hypothetical protein KDK36_18030 [Leptospiraceae bacterium]|nr:hypothetical protein [Leptospiraceae bacterium]